MRAAAVAALAGMALAVPVAPATAAACGQGTGVTVVVDFASLGGGTQTRCTPGDPATGLAALRGAGFTPTRAAQEPGYFLCRIDGKPADDPCQRTSPANAYWSYWHARPGGTWTYSSIGPADYDPAPGTVEGWAFGAGKPPSSAPPQAARPSSAPAAATPATRPSATRPAATTAPSSPSASAAAAAVTAASRPTVTTPPSAGPSPSPSPRAAPSVDPDAVDRTFTERTYAVPWSVVLGVLILLALVAAGLTTAARRRREQG